MIDKPIHRRQPLVAGDRNDLSFGRFWLLPALLLIQSLFVGSTFDSLPTTFGAFFVGLLVATIVQQWSRGRAEKAAELSDNATSADGISLHLPQADPVADVERRLALWRKIMFWPTLLITAVLVATLRVVDHMTGNLNPVAMLVDAIAHTMFVASVALWVFHPRRGHPAMLGCGLLIVLTTVTGGGVSHTINGQLAAALATVIAFVFSAEHILGSWQTERSSRVRTRRQKRFSISTQLPNSSISVSGDRGRGSLLYSVLALSVLLMSTSAAGHMAFRLIPGLQLEFFDRLSQSLESVTSRSIIGGTRYVRGSKLGSIKQHMLGDPSEPAVRAFAVTAPGYLRGTVFDDYSGGAWRPITSRYYSRGIDTSSIQPRNAEVEMPGQIPIQGKSTASLDRVTIHDNPSGTLVGTIEVHNVPFKGQLVFSTLSTDWIEASSYGVLLSHHDLVIKGIDTREPYILGISSEAPREKLTPLRKQLLLNLPSALRKAIVPITESICDGRLTARSKARAIEDYFQSNYTYSLRDPRTPPDADPIVNFLQKQHPAHCEFFASAAAVMLRSVGVPTRYVTGYVVTEQSEDDTYWLARNRDAHAWVEAYDEITEQWFPVEATVGRTYRTLMTETELIKMAAGSQDGLLDSEDDQSLLSLILGRLLSLRTSDSLTFVFRIAQLPLFCMLVALLWIRNRQKLRAGSDPMEFESRQMLHRVDRRVRKYALVRDRNETLHQFASRVESVAGEKHAATTFLMDAAEWYRSFAAARYRGIMPAPMNFAK